MSEAIIMPRKPKSEPAPPQEKKARKTQPVQIDVELARIAAVVAAHDDTSVGELLNAYLRPFLWQHYQRVQEEIAARLKRKGGGD